MAEQLNERMIQAKEELARKRAAQGKGIGEASKDGRVPPGQRIVDNWPVLDLGIQPMVPKEKFSLRVFGACSNSYELSFEELLAMGEVDVVVDWHCVTTWSILDMQWHGVPMTRLIERADPSPDATHVMFHGSDGYTTNVGLEDCVGDDCMLMTACNDEPLSREHGGPVRGMIPHLYAWKSAKWISGIEFMTENKRGFWEVRGYHNHGDPFKEERYSRDE